MTRHLSVLPFAVLVAIGASSCDPGSQSGVTYGCTYGGASYVSGATFAATDGCNTCACMANGVASCTEKDCFDGGPNDTIDAPAVECVYGDACMDTGSADTGLACSFDATYVYGFVGGNQTFTDTVTLAPPLSYALIRTAIPGDTAPTDHGSCAPPLPACNDAAAVDASDIMDDLADPTVQSILSLTTTRSLMLGVPNNPDSPIFSLQKEGTAGFLVASSCPEAVTDCTPVPPSISKLVTDLTALDRQQLRDPSCP